VLDTGNLLAEGRSAGGAYILLPASGQGDYGAIQRYVRDLLDGRPPGTPGAHAGPSSPRRGARSGVSHPEPRPRASARAAGGAASRALVPPAVARRG
jgi:hypothetical protein